VLLTAPVNVSAPVVSGTASVGSVLTTTNGTWDNEPTSYTYQWKRNGSNILSATSNTYTIVAADISQSITCTVTATNDAGSASATSNTITPTWETDAQAFITAAAITDPTQQSAVNQLVVDLKADGIWSKMKAIYPFVGGTASTHKFNLKNPLDTDAAFRLVFSGGIIHDSNGITLNGVNGFVSTFFNAFTNNLNNGNISIYNRTNNAGSYYDFSNLTGSFEQTIIIKFTDNKYYINSGTQTYPNFVNADARGLYSMNYNTTNIKGYKNGSIVITENKVSTGVNNNYTIGRNSSGQYSNRNYAFASIGDGLNDTEATNLNTRVTTFQTALNRNV
jgi:hypothetical protein